MRKELRSSIFPPKQGIILWLMQSLILLQSFSKCITEEGFAQELKRKGAKMQAKLLAPAATQYEFAQRSFHKDKFQ